MVVPALGAKGDRSPFFFFIIRNIIYEARFLPNYLRVSTSSFSICFLLFTN